MFEHGGRYGRFYCPPFLKTNMSDFKRVGELIDTYYPEISERLKNGKRERK